MLEAIGHVEELHDFGSEVPLAREGLLKLVPDGGLIVRERQGVDLPTFGLDPRSQVSRLGLLAALVQPFKGNQHVASYSSHCSMSSMV